MTRIMLGVLIGSLLTGTLGYAVNLYDSNVTAPSGSVKSFDYYRQRQAFLDAVAMRRNSEEAARHDQLNPCRR